MRATSSVFRYVACVGDRDRKRDRDNAQAARHGLSGHSRSSLATPPRTASVLIEPAPFQPLPLFARRALPPRTDSQARARTRAVAPNGPRPPLFSQVSSVG